MIQTLTTERLKYLTFHRSKLIFPASHEEAAAMARELLANREEQPVAYLKKSIIDSERFDSADPEIILHPNTPEGWHSEYQAVFTAPPAPAVPDKPRLPPHVYRDLLDMLQEAAIAYGGTQQLRAQLSSALSIHVQPDHPHTRAAMLAQPVSQHCEWTYDEHDSKWDSSCGDAWMFCDGGPTENGVKFCQNCGKPVLLAAAPEGGN